VYTKYVMPRQNVLGDYCQEQIRENGYVSLTFGMGPEEVEPLFAAFDLLVEEVYEGKAVLGQHIINALASETPGRPDDSRGYITRRRIGEINPFEPDRDPATENKDQMHFTPMTPLHAREYFRSHGGMPESLRTMIALCMDAQSDIRKAVRPAIGALGVDSYLFAPRGHDHLNVHILRFLKYLPISADDLAQLAAEFKRLDSRAELHFDRAKFAVAGSEDTPGLVGVVGNNGYRHQNLTVAELDTMAQEALATPIHHQDGYLKLFPGAGYNRLPEDLIEASGDLPLLLHGVTNVSPGKPRYAFVEFINEHGLVTNGSVPSPGETGFSSVRKLVEQRQRSGVA